MRLGVLHVFLLQVLDYKASDRETSLEKIFIYSSSFKLDFLLQTPLSITILKNQLEKY